MRASDALLSRDTPRALELLKAARRHLLEELLPSTQGGDRYSALMIANALTIALAELEEEGVSVSSAIGNEAGPRLCRQLRAGTIDDLFDEKLLSRLHSDVDQRLRVTNPKRLVP